MIPKFLALLGLSLPLFAIAPVAALAQVGSPYSCQSLEASNPQAFAQLCGEGARETVDFDTPILGGEDPEETVVCVGLLLPGDFPAGARIRVAEPLPNNCYV
jgi:hypothetical protein